MNDDLENQKLFSFQELKRSYELGMRDGIVSALAMHMGTAEAEALANKVMGIEATTHRETVN